MPEVVACPKCSKKLRVPEDLLGKRVKCPTCGHTFTAELAPPPSPPPQQEEEEGTYRVEGSRRRKVEDEEEERPSRRRRFQEEDDDEEDRPRRRRRSRYSRDDDDDDDDDGGTYRRPRRRRSYLRSHRGGTILTLGIIGLFFSFCCCLVSLPLSIAAVSMGSSDMQAFNRGEMDPSGKGMTVAGLVCGVIGIILSVIFVFINIALQSSNNYRY